jgi:2-methylaconitate isomerase
MLNQSLSEQIGVRCVLMRGGTSKGLYFHATDVPAAGPERDRFLKRVMGTPDVMQIDGLGGSRLVTSKIAIVERSSRADAEVNYTFAQIAIERDGIGYEGNCGNISSGVGPFAIDEGLVEPVEPITRVRIYNTNTDKVLTALVPVVGGKARVSGDFAIAGVPGHGAEIVMDYSNTIGAKTGRLLPTDQLTEPVAMEDGTRVKVTICDVANPCVFVHARDVGLTGSELPGAIMDDQKALPRIFEIQAKACATLGFCPDWKTARAVGLPLLVLVAEPADYVDMNGTTQKAADMDLRARLLFLGKCHESMAGTGSMCTAAASRIAGSIVNQVLSEQSCRSRTLRIGHPLGVMDVTVEIDGAMASASHPNFRVLGFGRTARRLMDGVVYTPRL